jgi:two-component system response regulator VicR
MKRDERVLIVEDNPLICRAIEDAGVQLQFECDCATDGWDAIEKLETGDYTAIVIDADIPRQSGYGVLTYLREEVGEDMSNVILMTSSTDRDEVRRKVGANMLIVDKANAVAEITRFLKS